MGIQVANSLHAAATLVISGEDSDEQTFSQSPNGRLIQRVVVEGEGDIPLYLCILDFPLDEASCSYECNAYVSLDPNFNPDGTVPFIPVLIHLDDTHKLLLLLDGTDEAEEPIDSSYHIAFTNYQANLVEQIPVETVDEDVLEGLVDDVL